MHLPRALVRSIATWSLLGSLGVSVVPAAAFAQEAGAEPTAEALKRAREQFGQALALQTAGDWAGALALLKEVAAVKSTPQVRFNMALCEERLGKLVAALGDYELAAADARAEHADQVAEEVEARLESLRAKIPKLTVKRGSGAEAAIIALDGVSLGDQVIGTPMPTDPGPHTIEARAPGFKPFRQSVRVAEQQSETIEIVLEPEPVAPPSAAGGRVTTSSDIPGARIAGYVVGGIGIASLGASGIFFGLRAGKISDLDKQCPNRECPSRDQQSDIDAGKRYTTIANVTLAVGAAAVAGGLVLILTSGGADAESSVALAPAPGGAQLYGRF